MRMSSEFPRAMVNRIPSLRPGRASIPPPSWGGPANGLGVGGYFRMTVTAGSQRAFG